MAYYDEELRRLQEQIVEKRRLQEQLRKLEEQRRILDDKARELETVMFREKEDVDKLERMSLASCFYALVGKKGEKLDRERAEACAARIKYETAVQELEAVQEDLERKRLEFGRLAGCEDAYQKTLQAKAAEIRNLGGEKARELTELEEKIGFQKGQEKEIEEAIRAGRMALDTSDRILDVLGSAENWGTWDLIGGGMVTDLVKHQKLDEAQSLVQRLQGELRRFQTELADVVIQADMQVNIDGFLRFADYFFDGLFADWTVLGKIKDSKSQMEGTRQQILHLLNCLQTMKSDAERQRLEAENRHSQLITE